MNVRNVLAAMLLCAGLSATPHAARAAQSYDNCTGFIDSLPTTISTQGVWCLRKDLSTAIANGNAITIATNNVTIDCNDFKVGGLAAGPSSATVGILADGRQNTTIRHCNIRGFYRGVYFSNGAGQLLEDNRFDNNLYVTIYIDGDNNRVRRNAVYATGGATGQTLAYGISARANITDNIIDGAFTAGTSTIVLGIFSFGPGTQVSGNVISGLALNGGGAAYGIYAAYDPNTTQSIAGNRILGGTTPINGIGIAGTSANFCSGNTITGFSIAAMAGCTDDGGNGLH